MRSPLIQNLIIRDNRLINHLHYIHPPINLIVIHTESIRHVLNAQCDESHYDFILSQLYFIIHSSTVFAKVENLCRYIFRINHIMNVVNILCQRHHIVAEHGQSFIKRIFVHNNLLSNITVLADV